MAAHCTCKIHTYFVTHVTLRSAWHLYKHDQAKSKAKVMNTQSYQLTDHLQHFSGAHNALCCVASATKTVQLAPPGFKRFPRCLQHKKMLLQQCRKIKSLHFAATKIFYCNKTQYDFSVAYCLQHLFRNKIEYDDNFSRKFRNTYLTEVYNHGNLKYRWRNQISNSSLERLCNSIYLPLLKP